MRHDNSPTCLYSEPKWVYHEMTNWSVAEASIRCATLLAELLEIFTSNGDYFRQNLLGSTFAGPKDKPISVS